MDTNSNIPAQKKVVSVEILHLDDLGYGPGGQYTRRVWREACLNHLFAGTVIFAKWQEGWITDATNMDSTANFDYKLIYDDGSAELKRDFPQNPCTLDYVGCIFEESINLAFKYYINANFKGAIFKEYVVFSGALFKGFAFYSDAIFHHAAHFTNCKFEGYTFFNYVNFNYEVDFTGSEFIGEANFQDSIFQDTARFCEVKFKALAYFKSSKFKNFAWFFSANFFGQAIFTRAVFLSDCIFDKWFEYSKYGAEFYGEVNFENVSIENVGHFECARFAGEVPSFLGVDNEKTLLVFSGDEHFNKDDISEDAVKRLGQLKRLADEHGQTDQALMFNAFELRAKAKQPNAGWGLKLVTGLYEYVSNFGRSFLRPLAIYASILFLTFLVALEHSAYNAPRDCPGHLWWQAKIEWEENANCKSLAVRTMSLDDQKEEAKKLHLSGIRAASEYTLYRAAGVLDFSDNGKATDAVARRLFGQSIEPWWMRIWGVFKAIASTALLFLAALGLRNKYRIK